MYLKLPIKEGLELLEKDQRYRSGLFVDKNITENKWKPMANCETSSNDVPRDTIK